MTRIPFVVAVVSAALALPALAQDRPSHRGDRDTSGARTSGGHSSGGHASGGQRHWNGGSHGGHYNGGHYRGSYYGHRYYYGGWPAYAYPYYSYLYPAPLFGYAFEPAPYYAPPGYIAPYPEYAQQQPAPMPSQPQREYRERSYANIDPNLNAPQPPAPKAEFERIALSATELFAFDQATLRAPQPKLDEIARALVESPSITDISITGYTDRLGSDEYNLKLSQRRAEAVKQYLVQRGVAESRLNAIGRAKANPVVHCDEEDREALIRCLEPNRRVEVERITIERAVPSQSR